MFYLWINMYELVLSQLLSNVLLYYLVYLFHIKVWYYATSPWLQTMLVWLRMKQLCSTAATLVKQVYRIHTPHGGKSEISGNLVDFQTRELGNSFVKLDFMLKLKIFQTVTVQEMDWLSTNWELMHLQPWNGTRHLYSVWQFDWMKKRSTFIVPMA